MNDDIIRMAKEAWGESHEIFWFNDGGIERFASLVRADEREACAAICDTTPPYPFRPSIEAAHAIRKRGEK